MNTNYFTRRTFLKMLGSSLVAFGLPRWYTAQSVGGELPIPPLISGTDIDGVMVYDLTAQIGTTQLLSSGPATETWGYNGSILGPTLHMRKGDEIQVNVTNQLGETTTTHWHGLHVPAIMDGTPHQPIEDGETWRAMFTMLNRASMCWYHPHVHGKTGEQVYRGLAGLIYITDAESEALALPQTYGVDDIPLIVQDRKFDLISNELDLSGAFRKGNRILVNGEITPSLSTHAQMIRLRLHNGSNARLYNFGFSDERSFYQIASDGGLLQAPVLMKRLFLTPGERAEIVVDFSTDMGQSVELLSYNSELELGIFGNGFDTLDGTDFLVMTINIGPPTAAFPPITTLPNELTTITRILESEAVNAADPRQFELQNGARINGLWMNMGRIDHVVTLDTIEIWEIHNVSGVGHPFHIHDDMFQILSRDGVEPPPNELGWKDTVFVQPQEVVKVIRPFVDFADSKVPYMFHCHLLEHEDAGMMGQFTVVEDANQQGNKSFLPMVSQ